MYGNRLSSGDFINGYFGSRPEADTGSKVSFHAYAAIYIQIGLSGLKESGFESLSVS